MYLHIVRSKFCIIFLTALAVFSYLTYAFLRVFPTSTPKIAPTTAPEAIAAKMRPNKQNQGELESKVFIEIGWACEVYKAAK